MPEASLFGFRPDLDAVPCLGEAPIGTVGAGHP